MLERNGFVCWKECDGLEGFFCHNTGILYEVKRFCCGIVDWTYCEFVGRAKRLYASGISIRKGWKRDLVSLRCCRKILVVGIQASDFDHKDLNLAFDVNE